MSDKDFDVIVVGAGHNSLSAAAYLQKCGLKTLVLEKNAVPGGGAISKDLGMPGFMHDTHATGVVHLQGHPILTADELELKAKFGLRFIYPEATYMTVFGDGDTLTCYADLDKTCAELARYSEADARAYREMVAFMDSIMPMINMSMARPPVPFNAFLGMLGGMPGGNDLLLMLLKSAQDIVVERFEHEKVRVHLLKWVAEGLLCSPEQKTTGIAMLYLIGLSHAAPAGVPEGGMISLSLAMIRCIEHYGGEVRLNAPVKKIINRDGVARSVELASGEVLTARRAVVATIHPFLLGDMVDGLDPELVAKARKLENSDFAGILVNCALREKPIWKAGAQMDGCLYINVLDDTELLTFRQYMESMKLGKLNERPIACVSCHTNFDPTRAPEGQHSLYIFALTPGRMLEGGFARWDTIKEQRGDQIIAWLGKYIENLTPENIIARHVDTPLDMMRHSPSFQNGDACGIGMFLYQMMGARPMPELSQYRVPGAEGLYLCGPAMHPGGGMTGGGRPVAIRLMEDIGVDYSKVIRS